MTPHEKAQLGLKQIESAVIDLLTAHGDWMSRPDIAKTLGIESSYAGSHGAFFPVESASR